jgi:hypothetical protein
MDRADWLIFSSLCQRQCELLPSLGFHRPLTFHILIFSSETHHKQEWPVAAMFVNGSGQNEQSL